MFAIEFTEAALTKVNKAGQISISYSTRYDLSEVTGNGTYTLVNGGRTPSNSAAANTETALLAQLNKQVSTIGSHNYTLESNAYTDGQRQWMWAIPMATFTTAFCSTTLGMNLLAGHYVGNAKWREYIG